MASSDNTGSYTLPDGTRVWLNRGGRLSYNQNFGGRERIVAIDGEGYFEVARNENCPFIVNMHDNLQVKVLGTEFNVLSNPADHSAEVILRSGSVQVSDTESKELVILKPDQKFSWDMGRTEVTAVNADDCCRWYERRLSFDNVRLCDILESLSHKYQTRITCNATDLKDKRMSLTVRDESLEDIMEVVSTLLPVRWERHGMTIIIDNKNQKH
ncbi:MAG TPA: Fe2+-dicitrate sensor protein, partial [Rikenellaceae bacterium]|nr:Fe2+-dicitrate sensor protein [Rikenellaceae bacterium]